VGNNIVLYKKRWSFTAELRSRLSMQRDNALLYRRRAFCGAKPAPYILCIV